MTTMIHRLLSAGSLFGKVRQLWKRRRDLDRRRTASTRTLSGGLVERLEDRSMMAIDVGNQLPVPDLDNSVSYYADYSMVGSNVAGGDSAEGEAGTDAAEGEPANNLVQFAKNLAAAGVKFYGAAWNADTTAQRNLFGDGGQFLPFIEVTNNDRSVNSVATTNNITVYPTWVFPDNSRLEGIASLETLATRSGVAIPQSENPTFANIGTQNLLGGSPLWVGIDGYDPNGGSLTYTVTSDNPLVTASISPSTNRSVAMNVQGFGTMVFQLFDHLAPRATNRIAELANAGFYNDTATNTVGFHRITRQSSLTVIQGGDPLGNGTGGSNLPDFDDQFNFDLQHNSAGLLSMAKSSDDTNNSQFFVLGASARHLDFNHTVFGMLTEGDAVRAAINAAATNTSDAPLVPIIFDTVQIINDTENAVLNLKAAEGATGSANVTVTVTDAQGNSYQQTFAVNVTPDTINGGPFLSEIDTVRTTTGTNATLQLVGNDVEGNALYFDAVKPSDETVNYTVTVNNDTGLVTITPPSGFVGSFEVLVGVRAAAGSNTSDAFDTQRVTVEVAPVAPALPDLADASDSGVSNTDNITNTASHTFTIGGVTSGAVVKLYRGSTLLGQATASGTSVQITTTNLASFADGVQSITATQTVGGVESVASAVLSVTLDRLAPVALTSTAPTAAEVGINLNYNAQHPDESTTGFRYSLTTPPTGATIDAVTGVVSWVPTADQVGTRSFGVVATDAAGNIRTQSVTVSVTQPVVQLVDVILRVVDANGNEITSIANGGTFFLQMVVKDLRPGGSDAGVFSAYADVVWNAAKANATGSLVYGSSYTSARSGVVSAGLIDEVGGTASLSPLGPGEFELFKIQMQATQSGTITFSSNPADNNSARPVLLYNLSDDQLTDQTRYGSVSLNVDLPFDAVNDTFNVNEDSNNFTLNPLQNDTIVSGSGSVLTIDSVGTTSSGGTVTVAGNGLSLLYTPAANFVGTETFTYTVKNQNGDTDTATITVQVANVNDPPVATNDTFTVAENSANTTLDVLGNDLQTPDTGETLRVQSVSAGSNGGTLSIGGSGSHVVYRPANGYIGTETFTYVVSDGNGGTATGTVTVNVTNANDNPVAVTDQVTVAEDSDITLINVLANDTTGNDTGETLTVTAVGVGSKGGTITIVSGGTGVNYKPAANFQGSETFTYTISDGNGGVASGTVIVTVTNSNDNPTAVADAVQGFKNTTSEFNPLANDTSAPDPTETLTITAVTQGTAGGTVAITQNGTRVNYTPASNFSGTDTFTYTISDGNGGTATQTVTVNVLEFIPSQLRGYVYFDSNNTGVREEGESPISGITITLTGTATGGTAVNRTTTTSTTGFYEFTNLAPGTYTITQTQPAFLLDGREQIGSQGGTSTVNDKIVINLAQNTNGQNNNFGELGLQVQHRTINDLFGSSFRTNAVASVSTTAGSSFFAPRGTAWAGYTNGTAELVNNSTQLRLTITNPAGQRVQTTLAITDKRLTLLASQTGGKLFRINALPTSLGFTVVTTSTANTSGGEGEPAEGEYTPNASAIAVPSMDDAEGEPTSSDDDALVQTTSVVEEEGNLADDSLIYATSGAPESSSTLSAIGEFNTPIVSALDVGEGEPAAIVSAASRSISSQPSSTTLASLNPLLTIEVGYSASLEPSAAPLRGSILEDLLDNDDDSASGSSAGSLPGASVEESSKLIDEAFYESEKDELDWSLDLWEEELASDDDYEAALAIVLLELAQELAAI